MCAQQFFLPESFQCQQNILRFSFTLAELLCEWCRTPKKILFFFIETEVQSYNQLYVAYVWEFLLTEIIKGFFLCFPNFVFIHKKFLEKNLRILFLPSRQANLGNPLQNF